MVITKEVLDVIAKAPFIPITTVSAQGEPHSIVVGKVAEVREGDILGFGVYKMDVTQQNIKANGIMQVIIATMEGGPKGFRLEGKACVEEKLVLFKAEKLEKLL
ncbi:pyridoxamine 5'-phosphate oxidase family protein [Desulfosporosinus sp. PR]|uniref:pyridoxamine 5'-phosphate oxidase family protein n=1 Tax=Candidatus Desulfosporosinus nitrosoreducens TaxID=3401928 RepID=UPI0027FCE7A3|nr:pyridoxamine 5'-phosphate oxidase family protein [Desulfosporosinus sp. PR]MDQ7097181.1 pyridoxamine 5'-phosphate oxidase family protein [Desulfosporosinus sp. PR]